MRELWNERTERERLVILIAGLLFATVMIFYLALAPAMRWREDAARQASRSETTFTLMRDAAILGGDKNISSDASDQPIRNILIDTAKANGVTLVFVNVRPDGTVEASLDLIAPATLFDWLGQLKQRHGVAVVNADIAREDGNRTMVRAQFVFGTN